jgi:hypothetical protein
LRHASSAASPRRRRISPASTLANAKVFRP